MFLGVPVKLGKNGINQLIELKLNKSEMKSLHKSADAVRGVLDSYKKMKV